MVTKTETNKEKAPTRNVWNVDATNLIVGRMASLIAEKLLMGESITVTNAEKAVFTGNPRLLTKRWQTRLDLRPRGNPEKAPRFSKMPDRIVKEIIEGMLPSRHMRGRDAMRRLHVYIGIPSQMGEAKHALKLEEAQNHKTKGITSVLDLSQSLGYTNVEKK